MQFYPGTWLHKRGVYLHIWKASEVMQQLRADVFWYTKGKPYKFVLEPLNFADDIVRSSNSRKRAVFEN